MFVERMQSEGRYETFMARIEELRLAGGSRVRSFCQAMREFGYKNSQQERFLHAQLVKRGRLTERMQQGRIKGKKYRKQMKHATIIEEFNKLPDNAPNKVELAWVRSHPKMMQAMLARLEETEELPADPIQLTVDDIINSSNGMCPSKSAFTMLASWLKDPKEFQKQLLPEQRKASDNSGGKDDESNSAASDESLEDVERMLRSVMANG